MTDIDDKIDKYIIPIIKHLNRMGVVTYFSCAGHENEWAFSYIAFKYNRKFINYLWKNGIAILRHYNSSDNRFQYIVRPDFVEGFFPRTFNNEILNKLFRDRFLLVLSKYKIKLYKK